jgi:hypothetical protein
MVLGTPHATEEQAPYVVNGQAEETTAPVGGAPVEFSRAEIAGYRAGRMTAACFQALSETFQPQVAYQTAVELTKTILASPSGAKILEE